MLGHLHTEVVVGQEIGIGVLLVESVRLPGQLMPSHLLAPLRLPLLYVVSLVLVVEDLLPSAPEVDYVDLQAQPSLVRQIVPPHPL